MTSPQQTTMARSPIESLLYWGLIPAWGVPGLVDWWFHRRSGIERPDHGGTEESLIHSLMLAESGLPVLLALLGEVNPGRLSRPDRRRPGPRSGRPSRPGPGQRQRPRSHRRRAADPQLPGDAPLHAGRRACRQQLAPAALDLAAAVVVAAAAARCPIAGPVPAGGGRHPDRNRRHPLRRGARPLPGPPPARANTGLRGYSQVVSRHRDQNAEDDGHPERGGVDRQPPEGPHSGDGKPTGEKQAAANRENDPPA